MMRALRPTTTSVGPTHVSWPHSRRAANADAELTLGDSSVGLKAARWTGSTSVIVSTGVLLSEPLEGVADLYSVKPSAATRPFLRDPRHRFLARSSMQ